MTPFFGFSFRSGLATIRTKDLRRYEFPMISENTKALYRGVMDGKNI
jgi:hypothetical protein